MIHDEIFNDDRKMTAEGVTSSDFSRLSRLRTNPAHVSDVQIVLMTLVASMFFVICNVQWFRQVYIYSRIGLVVPNMYIFFFILAFFGLLQEVRSTQPGHRPSTERNRIETMEKIALGLFLVGYIFGQIFYLVWEFSCWPAFINYHCRLVRIGCVDLYLITRILYLGSVFFYIEWTEKKIKEKAKFQSNYRLLHVAICLYNIIETFMYENRNTLLGDETSAFRLCMNETNQILVNVNNTCVEGNDVLAEVTEFVNICTIPMGTEYMFLAITVMIEQWKEVAVLQQQQMLYEAERRVSEVFMNVSYEGNVALPAGLHDVIMNRPDDVIQNRPDVIVRQRPSRILNVESDVSNSDVRVLTENSTRWKVVLYFLVLLAVIDVAISLANSIDKEHKLLLHKVTVTGCLFLLVCFFCADVIYTLKQTHARTYTKKETKIKMEFLSIYFCSAGVYLRSIALTFVTLMSFLSDDHVSRDREPEPYWHYLLVAYPPLMEIVMTSLVTAVMFLVCQDLKRKRYVLSQRIKCYLWLIFVCYFVAFMFRSTVEMHEIKNNRWYGKFYGSKSWQVFWGVITPLVLYHHFHVAYIILEYMIRAGPNSGD